jgi:AcrR family transcriptional regulator
MTRAYRSALRGDQVQATRRRIIDALVAQAAERGRTDFSIADVAARAGVAERTVYRYFPTRDDLIAAVNEAVEYGAGESPHGPSDLVEMAAHVRALYAFFEANATLIEASHAAGLGGEIRAVGRKRRGEHTRALLDQHLAGLSAADRRRAFAVFRTMFGSQTWRTMRHELKLSAEETLDAVQWVAGLVMTDLTRRSRSTRKGGKR